MVSKLIAWELFTRRYLYCVLYQGIAAAMIVTLIAVVMLHLVPDSCSHWVIAVNAGRTSQWQIG